MRGKYKILILFLVAVPFVTHAALTIRSIDTMSWTKDYLDNPFSQANIDTHIAQVASDFPTLTHISIAIPMNTNAEALAERGSNFAIEPATYAARFTSAIHTNGLNVIWRGTDSFFEGIYDFSKDDYRNGNRYTYFGTNITDDFAAGVRNHGYGRTSADDNLSTNYLTSHQAGNDWNITNGELVGPAANGWVRTILFDANYINDLTMTAKVKKVGNQQIIVRATTDSNYPGYGCQLRDTTELRIERPGLENLGATTTKSWSEGSYYWVKLQAIGSAIKCKAWAVGGGEPDTWDIEITDTDYTNGYAGFSGEYDNGVFDDMTIDPEVDTGSWLYRAVNFIDTNYTLFADGDIIVPFAEANQHQTMTNQGTYNTFFIELKYAIETALAARGITVTSGYFSHLFTAVIQGAFNSQYNDAGMATYDHYGTAIGVGKRFQSFNAGAVGDANTYTVPTSITENATNREDFIPEKVALNKEIDVYIVDKGTGDWTMTIHDPDNNPVKMYGPHDLASTTESYTVTIPNASLSNGAMNTFPITWHNPTTDQTHHFHLTSTVADGTVKTTTSNDLNTVYNIGYKFNATPDALELDIRNAYADTGGLCQFLQEWGDYWSTDSNLSDPVRNQADHLTYLTSMYDMFQRLVDENILCGFNYWRAIGGHEAIYSSDSPYSALYDMTPLQTFYGDNPDAPSGEPTVSATISIKGNVNLKGNVVLQ